MATVLYIEDEESIRNLVKIIITRRSDITLIEAETGREGLALAFSKQPDIILLDISLPDIDGSKVLKQLRENPATSAIPVIAISGNSVTNTRLTAPGFNEYLTKPINIQAFHAALDLFLP